MYKETIFRIKKFENHYPFIKEGLDTPENEKYKLRENLNKILYEVIDYIQNKMKGTEILPSDIYFLINQNNLRETP